MSYTIRQIEAEHEKETQELQQCWMELRHVVRCIYHETGTGLAEADQDGKGGTSHDIAKMTTLVHRYVVRFSILKRLIKNEIFSLVFVCVFTCAVAVT